MTYRVQRKRIKGWRKPEGVVNVCRPSKWGNPFSVSENGREEAVRLFKEALYRGDLPVTVEDVKQLHGKPLMCWCRLDQVCHADILLEVANDK